MGSFNDLYICKENGHNIEANETALANNKLIKLNRRMHKLALEINHESNKR